MQSTHSVLQGIPHVHALWNFKLILRKGCDERANVA